MAYLNANDMPSRPISCKNGNRYGSLVQKYLPPPPLSAPHKRHDDTSGNTMLMYNNGLEQDPPSLYPYAVPSHAPQHSALLEGVACYTQAPSAPDFHPGRQAVQHPPAPPNNAMAFDPRVAAAYYRHTPTQSHRIMKEPEGEWWGSESPALHQVRIQATNPHSNIGGPFLRSNPPPESYSAGSSFAIETPDQLQPMEKVDMQRWMQMNDM
jgi:hypothetical protein